MEREIRKREEEKISRRKFLGLVGTGVLGGALGWLIYKKLKGAKEEEQKKKEEEEIEKEKSLEEILKEINEYLVKIENNNQRIEFKDQEFEKYLKKKQKASH